MENYSPVGFRTHFVSMDSEEVWWNFAKIMDCRLEPCVGLPGLRRRGDWEAIRRGDSGHSRLYPAEIDQNTELFLREVSSELSL